MGKFIDLTGQRFGRLVVVERAENYTSPNGQQQTQWLCKCDCGNSIIISQTSLLKEYHKVVAVFVKKKHNKKHTDYHERDYTVYGTE